MSGEYLCVNWTSVGSGLYPRESRKASSVESSIASPLRAAVYITEQGAIRARIAQSIPLTRLSLAGTRSMKAHWCLPPEVIKILHKNTQPILGHVIVPRPAREKAQNILCKHEPRGTNTMRDNPNIVGEPGPRECGAQGKLGLPTPHTYTPTISQSARGPGTSVAKARKCPDSARYPASERITTTIEG